MTTILSAQALTKKYGTRAALRDVALIIEAGGIHGLLGPNGSGKTTALHIITGLVSPDQGTVRIDGMDIADKASRRELGFAPDDLPLPAALTGREYLRFHDALRGRDDSARAAVLTEALGIAEDLGKAVGDYSHGMQRKLQLIAAVMHEPRLLVLDEPFRGLDPDAAATVRSLLLGYARGGRGVLVATHDMLRAERDCDIVTVLDRGAVAAHGTPAGLIAASEDCISLEDVFLRATGRQGDAARRAGQVESVFT